MTEFTSEFIASEREMTNNIRSHKKSTSVEQLVATSYDEALDHIERLQKRVQELEVQLKSKDIIINNQQGRLNYYATKELLGGKNE